jgi:hypothetical protein
MKHIDLGNKIKELTEKYKKDDIVKNSIHLQKLYKAVSKVPNIHDLEQNLSKVLVKPTAEPNRSKMLETENLIYKQDSHESEDENSVKTYVNKLQDEELSDNSLNEFIAQSFEIEHKTKPK